MPNQCVTINVHNPRVSHVTRLPGGTLSVHLGNEGAYHGTVSLLFADDAIWHRITRDVAAFLTAEYADGDINGSQYCPECSYIGVDKNDVTEHVFGNHPDAVAR